MMAAGRYQLINILMAVAGWQILLTFINLLGCPEMLGCTAMLGLNTNPINIIGLEYNITIYEGLAQVGCKLYRIDEWRKFTSEEVRQMDGSKATEFYPKLISIFDALGLSVEKEKEAA